MLAVRPRPHSPRFNGFVLTLAAFTVLIDLPSPAAAAPQVLSVTPSAWHRDDWIGARITGDGFVPPDSVWLARPGESRLIAQVLGGDSQQITCRLDLSGAALGWWDVVVQNPGGQQGVLPAAFEILERLPWSPDEEISGPEGRVDNPAAATDRLGNPHFVWEDERDGNREIYYKRWTGTSWTPDERLTYETAYSGFAKVAVDPAGNVHVVWEDDRLGVPQLYYKRWEGGSWTPDQRLTYTGAGCFFPAIAADSLGHVHVVWVDQRNYHQDLYYKRWDGASWTSDLNLNDYPWAHSVADPSITTDPDAHVHIVWADTRDGNWEVYYRHWDRVSWMPEERITNNLSESEKPCVASDDSGCTHVVWQDARDGNEEIYYRRWNGTSWTVEERITDAPGASLEPRVAADASSHVHVVWPDSRDGNADLFCKRWDGIAWTPDQRITYAPSYYQEWDLGLAADGQGRVHVAWVDWMGGRSGLFYKHRPWAEPSGMDGIPLAGGSLTLRCTPSPFRDRTVFHIQLPAAQNLALRIYDAGGRRVRTLVDGPSPAGIRDLPWDGRDDRGRSLGAGVYFYRLQDAQTPMTGRVIRVE